MISPLRPQTPTLALQFALVMALGRTGSTLVQGILNSFDGFCIRGENDNVCHELFRAQKRLRRRQVQFAEETEALDTPRHPWYGLHQVDLDAFTVQARALVVDQVLKPPPGTTHTGFKEIRYATGSVYDLEGYVDYLSRLFPGVRCVVNTRDPEAVAQSSFWRKREGDTVGHVHASQQRLVETVKNSDIPHVVIAYEDYTQSVDAFRPVADLFEQPWQPDVMRAVISQRHSI